ncbi:MAG: hypothetical protein ACI9VR_004955 [Cognaticolwellia sp.]|jgi:hypothetical protein
MLLMAALFACEIVPPYVDSMNVDDAFAHQRYKVVCKGLEMEDPETRTHATKKLTDVTEPIAAECTCQFAWDSAAHTFDSAILEGLEGSDREDMVSCFLPALEDAQLEERANLVTMLNKTRVPAVKERMAGLAKDSSQDAGVRAAAIAALAGSMEATQVATLVELLGDEDGSIRAAAAKALKGQSDETTLAALRTSLELDTEPEVRAAALKVLKGAKVDDATELVCTAMIEDESPIVRKAAVMSFKGTKRQAAMDCLRRKTLTEEKDGDVRGAVLSVLKGSPHEDAGDVLCDAIPFYMRTYIKNRDPSKVPGTDIAAAQNDRDFENSYVCYQKALRKTSGWTCHGRQYVSSWYREVGGKGYVPRCSGDPGAGEVVFQ